MSDPIDEIEKMLAERGWTRRHLLPAFGGSRSHMSEALTRKRALPLSTIRCLVFNYRMDANKLIGWYPTLAQPTQPFDAIQQVIDLRYAPQSGVNQ